MNATPKGGSPIYYRLGAEELLELGSCRASSGLVREPFLAPRLRMGQRVRTVPFGVAEKTYESDGPDYWKAIMYGASAAGVWVIMAFLAG
jgi:hypothetical protein